MTKKNVFVIGLGLIGGSTALALRAAGHLVYGFDSDAATLVRAQALGVIDAPVCFDTHRFSDNDILVLATPVLAYNTFLPTITEALERGAYVTDMGSTKAFLVELSEQLDPVLRRRFVPSHPIAGSEQSGLTAANVELFREQTIIVCPLPDSATEAIDTVKQLWRGIGAKTVTMDVEHHDRVLAATSHLPHFLAFALVDQLAGASENREIFQYAAGGFRDFTRIAASDPRMWADIAATNSREIVNALEDAIRSFTSLKESIKAHDRNALMGVMTRAKAAREHFSAVLQQRSYRQFKVNSMDFVAKYQSPIQGDIRVPGDKSMSHRSIMLGSLADGMTRVSGFLEGEDALATLQAFRDMGVVIEGPHNGEVIIHGVGIDGLKQPPGPLYVGNSGTTIRLLSGLLSTQSFSIEMSGDSSLAKRPMRRVTVPLREMGAHITTAEDGTPPIQITPVDSLKGIRYELPIASAQVKSALLLAGLRADGTTTVIEPAPTRDHTERMLRGFGYPVTTSPDGISLSGGGRLTACDIDVPSDISSAAFFLVAASITPGSDLTLRHVGVNPTRIGVINILTAMGADIQLLNEREVGGEPVADIRVQYAPLKGIEIDEADVPLAIDEFPVLFVAATCAEGTTILKGAEELRVKESDRIQSMADGLAALGADVTATPDGMIIHGSTMSGGEVVSHDDHRIAMAFAVASLRAHGEIIIRDCNNVATSFPNFVELANQVGLNIQVEQHA